MKLPEMVLPLALLAAVSLPAGADAGLACKPPDDPINIVTDVVVIRPVGAAMTLAGLGLFAGLTPLTALASIPAPHDAFNKVGAVLVGAPYGYTFIRPLGYFSNTCE